MADFDPLALSDRLFAGELSIDDRHPLGVMSNELAEVTDGVAYVESLANVAAFSTDDGLCLVDTGGIFLGRVVKDAIGGWRSDRLHTGVYTHGHVDHVMGTKYFEAENDENGWPAPRIVGHVDVGPRFDRYIRTNGWNSIINQRQFQAGPGLQWPTEYRYPDVTYSDRLDVEVGGLAFELHHARGETDDHTWVWVPERRVLCTGDLFIWAVPNAGNPQKVQRYALEWSQALRDMAALGPELLLPGHGLPISGRDRVHRALTDTAALLDSLVDQTLALMNAGATLDEILHSVEVPVELTGQPYLQPVYDEPDFIVRNIWRLYGGWYEGDPSRLKPAPDAAVASEIATLAGGAGRLADRAAELVEAGELGLACHVAEMAALAAPDDAGVHRVRADVYQRRHDSERSTMARGVFGWAAAESAAKADDLN